MKKEEFEKELNLDRKQFPYEARDESEAREIAKIGLKSGIEDPDEVLGSNYLIREFLEKKYGARFEMEEKEKAINKEIQEKEQLKKLSGLDNVDRIKEEIDDLELKEKMRAALGISSGVDKEKIKQAVSERLSRLKEEEAEDKRITAEAAQEYESHRGWISEMLKGLPKE